MDSKTFASRLDEMQRKPFVHKNTQASMRFRCVWMMGSVRIMIVHVSHGLTVIGDPIE